MEVWNPFYKETQERPSKSREKSRRRKCRELFGRHAGLSCGETSLTGVLFLFRVSASMWPHPGS